MLGPCKGEGVILVYFLVYRPPKTLLQQLLARAACQP